MRHLSNVFLISLRLWAFITCCVLKASNLHSSLWPLERTKIDNLLCLKVEFHNWIKPFLACDWAKEEYKKRMTSCLEYRGWRSLMVLGFFKVLIHFFHWNQVDDSCCCGFCSQNAEGLCNNTACVNLRLTISGTGLITLCFHFHKLQCKI